MPRLGRNASACWQGAAGKVFVDPPKRSRVLAAVRSARHVDRNCAHGVLPASGRKGDASHAERESSSRERRSRVSACLVTFRELYRSHDGRFIIYEDEDGHLTSVDASRLA